MHARILQSTLALLLLIMTGDCCDDKHLWQQVIAKDNHGDLYMLMAMPIPDEVILGMLGLPLMVLK